MVRTSLSHVCDSFASCFNYLQLLFNFRSTELFQTFTNWWAFDSFCDCVDCQKQQHCGSNSVKMFYSHCRFALLAEHVARSGCWTSCNNKVPLPGGSLSDAGDKRNSLASEINYMS